MGKVQTIFKSRDSAVGTERGYRLDGRGSISIRGKFFPFSTTSIPALGPTQPHIQWVQGALSAGLKRLGREADHSLPSNAEVYNGGDIPSLSDTYSWRHA
jgi:hypothetical protein